jgi:hypothetical protein
MTRGELCALWTARRDLFGRIGAYVEGARIIDEFLADVERVEKDERDVVVGLSEAAALSGYSVEHLGRMVRHGQLTNHGRKGAPRVRVGDLPPRKVATVRSRSYDVNADARTLRNGRQ